MSIDCLDDDLLVHIFRNLAPNELRNVFCVNKRFLACGVEAKGWTYFPFDRMPPAVWKRFWEEVWCSEPVFNQLNFKMDAWVDSGACYHQSPETQAWYEDDLWRYSSLDVWNQCIIDPKVDEFVNSTGAYRNFAARLTAEHGPHWSDSEAEADEEEEEEEEEEEDWLQEWFDSEEYANIRKRFEPEMGSFDAQIMYGGANQLASVLLRVARVMFPAQRHMDTCDCPIAILRSESLWKKHQDARNLANPHQPPETEVHEDITVVVPRYKWIIDFVRLKVEDVDVMVEHFALDEGVWELADSESDLYYYGE